jgi:lauroyl/myristoyl acyltransferase
MYTLLATYSWLLAKLPEVFARANTWVLGGLIWILRKKIIQKNLADTFPEKSKAWRNQIALTSCRRTAEMALYAIASPSFSEAEVRKRIKIDESLRTETSPLRSTGKGTVLFIPHLTLMEMMTAVKFLDPELGKKDWVTLYRPLDVKVAETWVKNSRERFGVKLVSRREGFGQVMKAVREGQIAAILFDQNTQQGSRIHFLGKPCAATDLPGIIAQRFQSHRLIFWAERTGFWRCVLKVSPLQALDSVGLTLESNQWLENYLRSSDRACSDWLWAHNRWKAGDHDSLKPLQS